MYRLITMEFVLIFTAFFHLVSGQTIITHHEVDAFLNARCPLAVGLGECVHNYQCDPASSTIIADGRGIIDPRLGNDIVTCPLPLVCCGLPDPSSRSEPKVHSGCGWRNKDGVNFTGTVRGHQAKPGEFPWLVAIFRYEQQSLSHMEVVPLGDGSLLHPRAVLTAAHVVDGLNPHLLRVLTGAYDINEPTVRREMVFVDSVEIHPEFNNATLRNDVAILYLSWNVTLAEHVAPICLPTASSVVPKGTRCISAGWGLNGEQEFNDILSMVELPILDDGECQNTLRLITSVGRYYKLHESFFCAGGDLGVDTCRGGGGAPLICPIEGQPDRYLAAGLASWDMECGISGGVPAVFARIARAREWIDGVMAEKGLSTETYTY